MLSRIAGWVSDEQFLDVAGLDGPARNRVAYDLLKLAQSQNDIHVAEIFSQPKTLAMSSRMGLTPGLIFDMSRSLWDLDIQANERLCEYLQTERPVLSVGSPKCKAFMDSQPMNRRDPTFSKTLEAGLSHLKSLMEVYHWQSEQDRCFFCMKILITAGVRAPRRCEPWCLCLEREWRRRSSLVRSWPIAIRLSRNSDKFSKS